MPTTTPPGTTLELVLDRHASVIAERHPNAQFIAAARIDLARAQLARGDLDAVSEHLAPVLRSTVTEHRTVPVISRDRKSVV